MCWYDSRSGCPSASERREELEREAAVVRPEDRDIRVGLVAVERVADRPELGADPGDLG